MLIKGFHNFETFVDNINSIQIKYQVYALSKH